MNKDFAQDMELDLENLKETKKDKKIKTKSKGKKRQTFVITKENSKKLEQYVLKKKLKGQSTSLSDIVNAGIEYYLQKHPI